MVSGISGSFEDFPRGGGLGKQAGRIGTQTRIPPGFVGSAPGQSVGDL